MRARASSSLMPARRQPREPGVLVRRDGEHAVDEVEERRAPRPAAGRRARRRRRPALGGEHVERARRRPRSTPGCTIASSAARCSAIGERDRGQRRVVDAAVRRRDVVAERGGDGVGERAARGDQALGHVVEVEHDGAALAEQPRRRRLARPDARRSPRERTCRRSLPMRGAGSRARVRLPAPDVLRCAVARARLRCATRRLLGSRRLLGRGVGLGGLLGGLLGGGLLGGAPRRSASAAPRRRASAGASSASASSATSAALLGAASAAASAASARRSSAAASAALLGDGLGLAPRRPPRRLGLGGLGLGGLGASAASAASAASRLGALVLGTLGRLLALHGVRQAEVLGSRRASTARCGGGPGRRP